MKARDPICSSHRCAVALWSRQNVRKVLHMGQRETPVDYQSCCFHYWLDASSAGHPLLKSDQNAQGSSYAAHGNQTIPVKGALDFQSPGIRGAAVIYDDGLVDGHWSYKVGRGPPADVSWKSRVMPPRPRRSAGDWRLHAGSGR